MVSRRKRFSVWWNRAGMALRVTFLVIGATLFAGLVYWQHRAGDDSIASGSSVLVLVLVNLNIVVLCILAFLIGRNVVKLVFDRRRRILGSKLRMRLVAAFVGLTLIPTIILFILASGLLNRALDGWFSSQVENSINGAVEVARHHYAYLRERSRKFSHELVESMGSSGNGLLRSPTRLHALLESERQREELFSIRIIDRNGQVVSEAENAAAAIENLSEPPPQSEMIERAVSGEEVILFEEKGGSQFIRAYTPLPVDDRRVVLLTSYRLDSDLTQAMATVNESFRQYEQLKLLKVPLKSGYVLTLSMITGLLLFSAIWIAFYIAREMLVPIQRLLEATRSVAKGSYDFQLREGSDDEMGVLFKSFNQMLSDLKSSRRDSEQRRVYIETILSNLAVGVVALDPSRHVTLLNESASRILGLHGIETVLGQDLATVLSPPVMEQVSPLITALFPGAEDDGGALVVSEKQVSIAGEGRELKVLLTAGRIIADDGHLLGCVLLFDDITELSKAQHQAAWREVAQRIAHEIKNPLTPIQLSAERLAKLVGERDISAVKFSECTQTIVENVDSIKRLANEFSHFARMPRSEFEAADLNVLISDAIAPFARSHSDIVFQFIASNDLPELLLDREQIRRILINLIDNAIGALRADPQRERYASDGMRITVKTSYDRRSRVASFEVGDNGPGIRPTDKARIFDPYYTTKKGGTGLGLAIVMSAVSDHQGDIRLYDNIPRGAKFIVDLPESPRKMTLRRFAAG